MLRAAAFFLACGVLLVWPPIVAIRVSGVLPDGNSLSLLLLGCTGLVFGGFALFAALCGLPRLSVTAGVVRLNTMFGSKWASLDSLSAFEVTSVAIGLIRNPVAMASASIIGSRVGGRLRGKTRFVIPDAFQTPITTIVSQLNARHPSALDGTLAPPRKDENQFGIAGFKVPWLTIAVLAGLIVAFAAEQVFAIDAPGPLLRQSTFTLYALGGLNRFAILTNGEWYRLLTGPLLHADLMHLLFNGIALLMAGFILEWLVGRVWFLALFVIGALGGSLMSLAVNPATLTSVGASGAIMALFASILVLSLRLPQGAERMRVQTRSVRILIPSLLPLATTAGGMQIDYGAHIGGALIGGAAGLLLLRTWPSDRRLPRFPGVARAVAVVGLLAVVASSVAVAGRYAGYQKLVLLIPPDQIPKTKEDMDRHGRDLAARYPRDPRAHVYAGVAHETAHDLAGAESEFRTSLQQADGFRGVLGPQFDVSVRAMLAVILLEEGRKQQAIEAARTVCQAPTSNQLPAALKKYLLDARLCN
jgi:rhomboid protease GluP